MSVPLKAYNAQLPPATASHPLPTELTSPAHISMAQKSISQSAEAAIGLETEAQISFPDAPICVEETTLGAVHL